jgi:hypothetical protein
VEELKRKIERLGRQSAQMLTQLALSNLQLRALNMGQDRFRRRLWILPHAGGVYLEALESGEANAGPLGTWDGKPAPPIGPQRNGDEPDDEPMPEVPPVKSEPISDEPKPTLPVPKIEPEDKETLSLQEPMEVDQPAVKTELVEEATTAGDVKSEENTTAGMIPVTAEVVLKKEEGAQEALPALWFSLFPRTPCDRHSSANQGKDRFGSDEDEGEGRMSKKEEAAKEEAEKIIMQPIPEGLSHPFCFYFFMIITQRTRH